jgi:hypothetical protein
MFTFDDDSFFVVSFSLHLDISGLMIRGVCKFHLVL